jgi:hypothetical protein
VNFAIAENLQPVRPSGSNTTLTEAGKLRRQPSRERSRVPWSLQIPVRLAPSIFVDDIGDRDTADWPEPSHWVADRQ